MPQNWGLPIFGFSSRFKIEFSNVLNFKGVTIAPKIGGNKKFSIRFTKHKSVWLDKIKRICYTLVIRWADCHLKTGLTSCPFGLRGAVLIGAKSAEAIVFADITEYGRAGQVPQYCGNRVRLFLCRRRVQWTAVVRCGSPIKIVWGRKETLPPGQIGRRPENIPTRKNPHALNPVGHEEAEDVFTMPASIWKLWRELIIAQVANENH